MPSARPAWEPNEASEGISEVGIVCLCLSVFGKCCVGDGTFVRYFPTHDPSWRFPTCWRLEAVLGFRVWHEVEAVPREPYLLCAIEHVPISVALLRTPRSSAVVGSRLAGTSRVAMRLETAEDWMRHPPRSERMSANVRSLQAVYSSPMRLPHRHCVA